MNISEKTTKYLAAHLPQTFSEDFTHGECKYTSYTEDGSLRKFGCPFDGRNHRPE